MELINTSDSGSEDWGFESLMGNNMNRREELIQLAGQVINGIMSADNSVLSKLLDRSIHFQVAKAAVDIANDMLNEIDNISKKD